MWCCAGKGDKEINCSRRGGREEARAWGKGVGGAGRVLCDEGAKLGRGCRRMREGKGLPIK